jgi:hypothetical protein
MSSDTRLEKNVSLSVAGEQLTTILGMVHEQTGVKLEAASPMGDIVLVVRYKGTLEGLMGSLSQFFAASKEQRPIWYASGTEPNQRYRLERDLRTQEVVSRLRDDREADYRDRIATLLRCRTMTDVEWEALARKDAGRARVMRTALERANAKPQIMWHFFGLPQAHQQRILAGQPVTYSVSQLANGQDPDKFMAEWMNDGLEPPKGDSLVTFFSLGRGYQRGIFVRVNYGPSSPSHSILTGICSFHMFTDLEGATQEQDWLKQLGVSTVKSGKEFELTKPSMPANKLTLETYRGQFHRVAEAADINLIGEDYGWAYRGPDLMGKMTVPTAMSYLTMPTFRHGSRDSGHDYFWYQHNGVFMLRSKSWPEDEVAAISYRTVQKWKEVRRKKGLLTLDALAEMAALSPDALSVLKIWFEEAYYLELPQTMLRWYLRAPRNIKQQVFSQAGVTLPELGLTSTTALQEQDPASEGQITWTSLLQQYPPESIRLTIQFGTQKDRDGNINHGIGVILLGPVEDDARVMTIPLFPEP